MNGKHHVLLAVAIACGVTAAFVTRQLVTPALRVAPTEAARPAADDAADPLANLDLAFRAAYAAARAETLTTLRPVVIADRDTLTLVRKDGTRSEGPGIPPLYHRYKAVSHTVLAVYVLFAPWGDAPLSDDRKAAVAAFRAALRRAEAEFDEGRFPAADRARQRELLAASAKFLDDAVAAGRASPADVTAFIRKHSPAVMKNAYLAARAQIETTHATMSAWRKELPAGEWDNLHAVVIGPQMPRKRNILTQYFAKLLGQPGESRRVVYAEALWQQDDALKLLATHTLDTGVARAFFDDADRMEIDLLAEAARDVLAGTDLTR